jgi:hypothetical protein
VTLHRAEQYLPRFETEGNNALFISLTDDSDQEIIKVNPVSGQAKGFVYAQPAINQQRKDGEQSSLCNVARFMTKDFFRIVN